MSEIDIKSEVRNLIEIFPYEADRAREKVSLRGWFVGQVMKRTNGVGDQVKIREIVDQELDAA